LVFASIFLIVLMKFLLNKLRKRKLNLPPSPPKLPIIGNLHQLGNMPHLSLCRLAEKYGAIIYLQLGEIPTVVVSSARGKVMKTNDLATSSRPQIFSAKHIFYNFTDVVFSPYGAYWRNIRKICILELLSAKRVQSFRSVREEEVARLVHRISESYPGNTNLTKNLGRYANDVLCRVAFGRDFSRTGDSDRHGFQTMLDEYQELLGGFSVGEFFPSMEFIHSITGMKSKLQHTSRRFDQFLDEVIKEHQNPDGEKEKHKDFVDVLLDVQKKGSAEIFLTMDNVKAILLDMFAAGTDTTFITLDWAMTELIMNSKVMEKAQAEVRSIVGEREVVLESDLPHLDYMQAVIKETYRLHPPAPVSVPRESMEDITIDGYDIPAKTRGVVLETTMAFLRWVNEGFKPSLVFASIFLIVLMKFLLNKLRKGKLNLPPSPPKLPIINLHQLGNMPHLSLCCLAEKYDGAIIYFQLGEIPTVVVSSARLAKEVMKANDLATSSRPRIFSTKHIFYNFTDVVFSPYGAYWRHIRKICILELLSAKRVQSFRSVREEEVARLVHRISESYPGNTNLTKNLGRYENDVLCRVAFGRDISRTGDSDRHGFQSMLDEYQKLLGGFSVGEFFPSMEFIHSITGMKSKLQHTSRRFDQFLDEVIKELLNPDGEKEKHKDFVDVLLDVQKKGSAEIFLTMDNVKAILLDMFAARTDRTFITLDWAMTELIMNSKVMEKAQAEVRSIVGEREVVLQSDLPHLDYMQAVIKETYRLHPPAPVSIPRESMEDITIDGYDIPAKTWFYVNAWAIGRDPTSWENPEKFEPERFMGSKTDFRGQDFELIPFGAGRRIFQAITFATAIIELALAQLLHSFDWKLPPGIGATDLDLTEVFG
ncbi:LOW QUALITY PROTEIN: p450 domain-containing protein, partial [Cephalotus follicularis]